MDSEIGFDMPAKISVYELERYSYEEIVPPHTPRQKAVIINHNNDSTNVNKDI